MSKAKKNFIYFSSGGIGYGVIELIWRGRTHWTMIIAGGICFVIISQIGKKFKSKPLIYKASLCACGITAVELVFGIIFNMIFKMNVWDYSNKPFNLMGQICPLYSLYWVILACAFIPLADYMGRKLI